MKTLEEIKHITARRKGFKSWKNMYMVLSSSRDITFFDYENEVAEEYARQCCEEVECRNDELKKALQDLIDHSNNFLAANGSEAYNDCFKFIQVAIDVLNTPNVVTTK